MIEAFLMAALKLECWYWLFPVNDVCYNRWTTEEPVPASGCDYHYFVAAGTTLILDWLKPWLRSTIPWKIVSKYVVRRTWSFLKARYFLNLIHRMLVGERRLSVAVSVASWSCGISIPVKSGQVLQLRSFHYALRALILYGQHDRELAVIDRSLYKYALFLWLMFNWHDKILYAFVCRQK